MDAKFLARLDSRPLIVLSNYADHATHSELHSLAAKTYTKADTSLQSLPGIVCDVLAAAG